MTDLDANLRPLESLMTSTRPAIGYAFDTNSDRGMIRTTHIKSMSIDKLLAGTIVVTFNVGAANITLDGANKRIVVNDGTNDRVLIGYQAGGF